MFRPARCSSLVMLFLAVLWTHTAVGQSLAIHRNLTNYTWLEATSPTNIGYRFQASADYNNWDDISDQASGPLTFRIDTSLDPNRFFRLRPWTLQDDPITLVLIGDSTVADYEVNSSQFSGWGQGIDGYLKSQVRVVNLAMPVQSTKVFLDSAQKDYLVKIKPDFVLVQFGWIDSWEQDARRTSLPDYEANLKTIIQLIRDFKGTPILVTPPALRYFDATGRIIPMIVDRCEIVRKVAAELQTYLIDLNQLTTDLFNELGNIGSEPIASSEDDPAHFSFTGAEMVAGLVVNAFPGILRFHVKP